MRTPNPEIPTTIRDEGQPPVVTDAALLRRVQQRNQGQIIGKLLHDLRNPVHSMRITVELFSRLASAGGDTSALLKRAARYVGPAEAGLQALLRQIDSLSVWLSPPTRASLQAIAVNEWLAEIAMLLRESTRALQVTVESTLEDEVQLAADRPRLSHAILRWALNHAASPVVLSVRQSDSSRIEVEMTHRAPAERDAAVPFTQTELRSLIESAGGELIVAAEEKMSVSFERRG